MRGRPGGLGGRPTPWILVAGLVIAGSVLLGVTRGSRDRGGAEAWLALMEAGDALVAGATPDPRPGRPVSARVAYLLAFHLAQDVGDVEHVLAVADKLRALGEEALAAHVHAAARGLLEEAGVRAPPRPGPAPGPGARAGAAVSSGPG
jgi:hypothetical protein